MNIEELGLSVKLYNKLKRKGCNSVEQIRYFFDLEKLTKAELIELFTIFVDKNEIFRNFYESNEDDRVLIAQMDQDIAKYKNSLQEIVELSKHDGESIYLDKVYVVATNSLKSEAPLQ